MVTINNSELRYEASYDAVVNVNNPNANFSIEVNGVTYNADKSGDIREIINSQLLDKIGWFGTSDGAISFYALSESTEPLRIRLSPSVAQKVYSNKYLSGEGTIESDGTFAFKLQAVVELTASSLVINYGDGSVFPLRYISASKNGAAIETIDVIANSKQPNDELEVSYDFLYKTKDMTAFAFVEGLMVGVYPEMEVSPEGFSATMPVAGLSAEGVTIKGVLYDLVATDVDIGEKKVIITRLEPDVNTLEIYPTMNAPKNEDAYYAFGGDTSGNPIKLVSLAKAVVAI